MSKWIQEFLEDPKARYFVKIDEDFIANSFNLYGLKACVKNYALACDMIRRDRFPNREDTPVTRESVHAQAEILYGLLHARFILTKPGLHLMMEKYQREEFQTCPRVYCRGRQCLPYGVSDELGKETLKMYCPSCCDVYNVTAPELSDVDGAYFGPSWIHMFLHRYRQIIPKDQARVYVPKIFGFRICHASDAEDCSDSEYD